MLATFQRLNSSIRRSFRDILARRFSGDNAQKHIQCVNLLYKVHCNQLFVQLSPLHIVPFQHLSFQLLKPFSTSSNSCIGDSKPPKDEDLFYQVEKSAYHLLSVALSQEDVFKLSALWMQAMEGPCTESQPPVEKRFNNVIYWKYWIALGEMPKEEAAQKYLEIAKKYIPSN